MSNNGSNNPYVQISPLQTNRPKPMDTVCDALNRCSRKVGKATRRAETMADNFWNHIRIGSSLADAAVARIVQGTKVLTLGGPDILFQQSFGNFPGEKLIKSFACYLSTSTGPVIGTIYVSTKRVAFCSDYPLCNYPLSLQQNQSVHYKVVLQLDQLSTVSPFSNRFNPAEKYMQLVTVDGYEFYFMGFIAYDKALKTVREASLQYHNHSRESSNA
ncbi:GEM-like protein 1 [Glycine soja]|uniref:GEM-like protein 1 n=1 Tax=Glycine soja TaxID=3848 RepID=A0A0B2SLB9_GLYSO|nr:GEM-like protein 1 [Glycine soja]KHN47486.1 GEM-like protein 1 [Glycine soja]RZC08809.1 GEM-like protein 1 [Glycine soja]